MSVIQFCPTSKGDLLNYSYIFRKLELLGTDMKNVFCYRLGTMLHLDIQKGKGTTKKAKFQKDTGGTVHYALFLCS